MAGELLGRGEEALDRLFLAGAGVGRTVGDGKELSVERNVLPGSARLRGVHPRLKDQVEALPEALAEQVEDGQLVKADPPFLALFQFPQVAALLIFKMGKVPLHSGDRAAMLDAVNFHRHVDLGKPDVELQALAGAGVFQSGGAHVVPNREEG